MVQVDFKLEIINNKSNIVISDTTGDYNAVTNPLGWDSTATVTPSRSSVSVASLEITKPGASVSIGAANLMTTSFIVGTSRAYDVFSDPTNVVPTFTLEDGVWKYVMTITDSFGTFTKTEYSLRVNELKCKIGKLALGNLDTNKFYEVKSEYDRMVQAFECEEYVLAQEIYESVVDMLTSCYPYSPSCNC
jgi:hypothetical protein